MSKERLTADEQLKQNISADDEASRLARKYAYSYDDVTEAMMEISAYGDCRAVEARKAALKEAAKFLEKGAGEGAPTYLASPIAVHQSAAAEAIRDLADSPAPEVKA